ncbi:hypothetical protein [Magnaporthe oryzae chrysovirus 1]|uniref:Uncharacterized protein n=1 Tax=Magnaporthe oryzae chrysovirus 1-A TaxID=2847843 RepID=E0D6V6_9VIRU|nr:hypothetical protein [Magnaporthe oryzae chrysovirus 1]BAJ15136.1 hypothetical protein [Magnaporthe oryzae chrysovirus 1-A]
MAMGTTGGQLASKLRIDQGLGLPDAFLRQDGKGGGADGGADGEWAAFGLHSGAAPDNAPPRVVPAALDASSGAGRIDTLRPLVGDVAYSLYLRLGETDYDVTKDEEASPTDVSHSVICSYALEVDGRTALNRADVASHCAVYPPMVRRASATPVSVTGALTTSRLTSAAAACDGLAMHAGSGNNADVSLGIGREFMYDRARHQENGLESVFVRMWLVHLSVLARQPVTQVVDPAVLSARFANIAAPAESDAARAMRGVKINARGLTNTALALLVLGCSDTSQAAGLHYRARRYKFARSALSMYGMQGLGRVAVALDRAEVTGLAIVSLAERYGAEHACGAGLQTALMMYGVNDSGRYVQLKCPEPELHDDVATTAGIRALSVKSYSDLSDNRLLSLSLFVGRAWRQSAGHLLRSSTMQTTTADIDAVVNTLLPSQGALIKAVGSAHARAMGWVAPLVDTVSYVEQNYRLLWEERGIVHCLALGLRVPNSVLEEATAVIEVPYPPALSPSDDPRSAGPRAGSLATLGLVESLLSSSGEGLCGSARARGRRQAGLVAVPAQVVALAGHRVQFTLLSVASGVAVRVEELPTRPLLAEPLQTGLEAVEYVQVPWAPAQAAPAPAPPVEFRDTLDQFLHAYKPSRSVLEQPRVEVTPRMQSGSDVLNVVLPEDTPAPLRDSIMGGTLTPVSAAGVGGCAEAIVNSLQAQYGVTVSTGEIEKELQGDHSGGELLQVGAMASALAKFGDYRLVLLDEHSQGVILRAGDSGSKPVTIHRNGASYNALGRGPGRAIRVGLRSHGPPAREPQREPRRMSRSS